MISRVNIHTRIKYRSRSVRESEDEIVEVEDLITVETEHEVGVHDVIEWSQSLDSAADDVTVTGCVRRLELRNRYI